MIREARVLRETDEKHFRELMDTIKNLEATIASKDRTINDKDNVVKELSSKNLEMQQKLNALESMLAVKDDISNKLNLAN